MYLDYAALTTIKHFYLTLPPCFLKLQIFEVPSVVKKVVLKCHVVRIPCPVNLVVNLQSVYFDKDEGSKQPCKKDIVYSTTGLDRTNSESFDSRFDLRF